MRIYSLVPASTRINCCKRPFHPNRHHQLLYTTCTRKSTSHRTHVSQSHKTNCRHKTDTNTIITQATSQQKRCKFGCDIVHSLDGRVYRYGLASQRYVPPIRRYNPCSFSGSCRDVATEQKEVIYFFCWPEMVSEMLCPALLRVSWAWPMMP
jgi:hypothetical protein